MVVSDIDLDDVQMHIDDATTKLRVHSLTAPFPESSVISITRTSSPNTSKDHPSSPEFTPLELIEQAQSRKERQKAREARWVAREKASRSKSPVTPMRASTGGIEKRKSNGKWKARATDSRLSSELDRLLVGEGSSNWSLQSRNQHPLRPVLHSLPGFSFETELDDVKFRKGQRVFLGIEELMAAGGMIAAKEWLEGFLLLVFKTKANVLERYPMCQELDDVPLGSITMAKDVETIINKRPYDTALKVRRTMERRLCQPYDMRKLVEWTIRARCRFLETEPKIVPGFGAFGQVSSGEGTDLEKRLWAAVDARGYGMPRVHDG